MKNYSYPYNFSILVILFSISCNSSSQNEDNTQLTLKGEIDTDVTLSPHCGFLSFGTVIEFKIKKFSGLNYTNEKIGVIFKCPELFKDGFFEVGKTYLIKVTDKEPSPDQWLIPNEDELKKYGLSKRLWAIDAEKLD